MKPGFDKFEELTEAGRSVNDEANSIKSLYFNQESPVDVPSSLQESSSSHQDQVQNDSHELFFY